MDVILMLIVEFCLASRKWRKRIVAIVLWVVIIALFEGLVAVLHGGQATMLIVTLGGGLIASVVADRIAGTRRLPVPGLLAMLGAGVIAGVVGTHAVAAHFHIGSTAAEISMVAGASIAAMLVCTIVGVIWTAGSARREPDPPASARPWKTPDQAVRSGIASPSSDLR